MCAFFGLIDSLLVFMRYSSTQLSMGNGKCCIRLIELCMQFTQNNERDTLASILFDLISIYLQIPSPNQLYQI